MNNLDNLNVSGHTTLQSANINHLTVNTIITSSSQWNDDLRIEDCKLYVKEGRLYFHSPEIGEWALTPTKEQHVQRVIDTVS